MNPNTGEIREFPSKDEAEKAGFTIQITSKPRRSCKRCHGRGIEGYDDYGKAVPCSCVFRPTPTPPRRSQDLGYQCVDSNKWF